MTRGRFFKMKKGLLRNINGQQSFCLGGMNTDTRAAPLRQASASEVCSYMAGCRKAPAPATSLGETFLWAFEKRKVFIFKRSDR